MRVQRPSCLELSEAAVPHLSQARPSLGTLCGRASLLRPPFPGRLRKSKVGGAPPIHTCRRPRVLPGEHLSDCSRTPRGQSKAGPARPPGHRSRPASPNLARPGSGQPPPELPGQGPDGTAASSALPRRHLEKGRG